MFFHPNVFDRSPYIHTELAPKRAEFLDHIGRLFANRGTLQNVIIKGSVPDLLEIKLIQQLWPRTPCLIVIRDPTEVLVSNMDGPCEWIRYEAYPELARRMSGLGSDEIRRIGVEGYAARCLGRLFATASSGLGEYCRVIDYRYICEKSLREIASWFGVPIEAAQQDLNTTLSTYSKGIRRGTAFITDASRKQERATPRLERAVHECCRDAYQSLLMHDAFA
jgi:hypothetical protein